MKLIMSRQSSLDDMGEPFIKKGMSNVFGTSRFCESDWRYTIE